MFKCQISGKISEPGEKPYRVVIKTRPKTYNNKVKKDEKEILVVTTGFEIVREALVCREAYEAYMNSRRG